MNRNDANNTKGTKMKNNDALERLMGRDKARAIEEQEYRELDYARNRLVMRRAAERRAHQFSDDIGGCSANYRSPYFGR